MCRCLWPQAGSAPHEAPDLPRLRSRVRRGGLRFQMGRGGRWGGALMEVWRHFAKSCGTGTSTATATAPAVAAAAVRVGGGERDGARDLAGGCVGEERGEVVVPRANAAHCCHRGLR